MQSKLVNHYSGVIAWTVVVATFAVIAAAYIYERWQEHPALPAISKGITEEERNALNIVIEVAGTLISADEEPATSAGDEEILGPAMTDEEFATFVRRVGPPVADKFTAVATENRQDVLATEAQQQ